ncbi:4-hydroxy-tetrahydrodipicolinate synthase [Actimicrobium antarcticum]|uniref:4-hydroxy-tetrahydrodipicolinate synthase n=1 Tax=Actimicrobium antarcticum TaxID=1051899 RepID=A0ABP7SIA5_9BURK
MIHGSIVAIVTPMHADGSLDLPGLRKLIDWHIAEGTDGIVIVGTTGESPTVTVEEHCELIKVAVDHTAKRIPIIAGTGGNSTAEAIELTRYAKSAGADASLLVVPYYNRPTQEGMYQHFRKIAESVDLPAILYNVPGRTVADMHNDTIVRLAAIPGIIGVKDATGNIGRGIDLMRLVPASFAVYSGDDPTAMALMFCGGKGNISVTANIAPRAMHELCVAAMAGDIAGAIKINNRMLPLHNKLFVEPNPVPLKWAMHEIGLIDSGMRLPLVPLAAEYHETVRAALRESGLMQGSTH